jgi:AraC family transcriptional regulator
VPDVSACDLLAVRPEATIRPMPSYCAFHGSRLRAWSSPLVTLSETTYGFGQRTGVHAHAATTLALVLRGGFRERQGARHVECTRSSLLVRPAGVEHDDAFEGDESACFNLEIHPGLIGDRGIEAKQVRGGPVEWLAIRLLLGLREAARPEPVIVESVVADLVAAVSPNPCPSRIPNRVARTRARLEDRFAERCSLRDLARDEGVHPIHLAREFRRAYGESVGEALHRVRVEHASRLLLEAPRSIADVAASTGFADQAHLTRVFRRATGVTPARYRAALRDDRRVSIVQDVGRRRG